MELNPEQLAARNDMAKAVLVVAGAGSGKTRVLTARIAYMIEQCGVAPEAILAVTFSNKAAQEMVSRINQLLPFGLNPLSIGTFHAISARLLREMGGAINIQPNFVIYDNDDQKALVRTIYKQNQVDEKRFPIGEFLSLVDQKRNSGNFNPALGHSIYIKLLDLYEQALKDNNALDFGSLLTKSVELLEKSKESHEIISKRWQYILIDEFQDINFIQKKFIQLIYAGKNSIFAVGDEDQSIYAWRGADVGHILDFEKDFPGAQVHKLTQNYRSTPNILAAANAVIAHNLGRRKKELWSQRPAGEAVVLYEFLSEREEAALVVERAARSNDAAIFYRTNAQSRVLEEAAMRLGIPYQIIGGLRFYERAEIKDILAILRFLLNPQDQVSFRRLIKIPSRGLGEKTLEKIVSVQPRLGIPDALEQLAAQGGAISKRLTPLIAEIKQMQRLLANDQPLAAKVEAILVACGYLPYWKRLDSEEASTRLENIYELLTAIDDYQQGQANANVPAQLNDYLQHVSLLSDIDGWQVERQRLTMMTLHAAKGLEFESVFLTGLEEGLFPHERSLNDEVRLEEERRLCYVGMTRAKDRLTLSTAASRKLYNQIKYFQASRFLDEIPTELIRRERDPRLRQAWPQRQRFPSQDEW